MAENNLDRLKSDIKLNNPARLYVFHGEEAYLRRYYLDSLKKLLVEDFAEAFNFHRFRPETITPQAVLDSIEALPMMAQRSMLQIDDVNFFALGEDAAAYAKFFSDIPDYCTVVLNYDTVEFRPNLSLSFFRFNVLIILHQKKIVKQICDLNLIYFIFLK